MARPDRDAVRAAVPASARAVIAERAPAAEVVDVADADLSTIDFLVPPFGHQAILDRLPQLTRVAVVQTLFAGTDWVEDAVPVQATLCNARGARDQPVAEWIVGALLGATARLLEFAHRRDWEDGLEVQELGAWTVVIIGMGSIGGRLAQLLAPFGTRVVGVASRARAGVHGVDELPGLLPGADAIVLLAPLTDATRGLIGAAELAALRDGALVVNAGRGPVLDQAALLAEVTAGRLRAVLDVTDPEPPAPGDPLWNAPGTLCVTPHLAGDSERSERRSAELAGDQLARFCAGEPLRNVVRRGRPGP
jgi:phosphoglycerate dehydrogenase-like enzyme